MYTHSAGFYNREHHDLNCFIYMALLKIQEFGFSPLLCTVAQETQLGINNTHIHRPPFCADTTTATRGVSASAHQLLPSPGVGVRGHAKPLHTKQWNILGHVQTECSHNYA